MAITYTPTNNATPTYGEQSQSILGLQQSLNKKYAGVAGYTPLKEDSKYGPLTLAASGFKPAVAPVAPSDTSSDGYYSRTSSRQSEIDRLKGITTSLGDAPDLSGIRSELMQGNQGLIDAITAQYANTIAEERARGDVLNKRQRAINVGGGLAGSDFASAGAQKVEDSNLKAIRAIEDERNAKIASILSGVESRSSEVFQQRKNEYRQNAEDSLKKYAEFKDAALSDVKDFAASGLTAAQLKEKSPDTWNQLLEQTGYSDAGLTASFIANKPKPDFEETVGNTKIFGYRDPATGKVTTEKIKLTDGFGDFKLIGGVPYFVDEASGRIQKATGYQGGSGDGTSTASQQLEKSRGSDGFVDPTVYKGLYDKFVKEGGTAAKFATKYPPAKYVNPANTWLPDFLKNKTKVTGAKKSLF